MFSEFICFYSQILLVVCECQPIKVILRIITNISADVIHQLRCKTFGRPNEIYPTSAWANFERLSNQLLSHLFC